MTEEQGDAIIGLLQDIYDRLDSISDNVIEIKHKNGDSYKELEQINNRIDDIKDSALNIEAAM